MQIIFQTFEKFDHPTYKKNNKHVAMSIEAKNVKKCLSKNNNPQRRKTRPLRGW